VAGAKEVWSAVAGGEAHRQSGLAEQFALVSDSLKRLYPSGEVLAEAAGGPGVVGATMDEDYLFWFKFVITFFVSVVFPFVIGVIFLSNTNKSL
jgi:hypothetical protein